MYEQTFKQIEKDISDNKVMLYMKGTKDFPQCGFSAQVVNILNHVGAEYETRNVLEDESLRQGIKQFSNWPTIPQLYVDRKLIGGCDIVTELFQEDTAEFQEMLGIKVAQ